MKKDKGFERLIKKYENGKYRFHNNYDSHIKKLKAAVKAANDEVEKAENQIEEWAIVLKEVSELEEADTLLGRIDDFFLLKRCMKRYINALEEEEYISGIKKKLENILDMFLEIKEYN